MAGTAPGIGDMAFPGLGDAVVDLMTPGIAL